MAGELIVGGIAFLLLFGRKKKKKKAVENGTHGGSVPDEPAGTKAPGQRAGSRGGSQGGSGRAGGPPANLAHDAIWVSADCKEVVYGDETGEAFWDKKGKPVAEKFILANYHDPYEVAKLMVISMAPCVAEFPVAEDGFDPMEEEFRREMFNRNFKDVYYLVQFLHDKIAELMDKEEFIVEFNDRCDLVFVGKQWERPVAQRMVRFYLDYMYPEVSESGHEAKHPTWPLADIPEEHMFWWDNVATAVINRMHPECGIEIVKAFKKDPYTGNSFFATRPGVKAMYESLTDLVNWSFDNRPGGLDFPKFDQIET